MIYYIILMYTWIFVQSPLRINWLIYKIQKYVASYMFLAERFVTIVDTIVMIIPDPNYLGSIFDHFTIKRIFFANLVILELNMLNWLYSLFFWNEKWIKFVRVCCITTPYKQIWLKITYSFENLWSTVTLTIAGAPSYSYWFLIFILRFQICQLNCIPCWVFC